MLMRTIRDLGKKVSDAKLQDDPFTAAPQQLFSWLSGLQRTLAYLVSMKAYQLTKSPKKDSDDKQSMEQQIVQTNLLSGGIDETFEKEFSEKTREQAKQYELIWKQQKQDSLPEDTSQHNALQQIIDADNSTVEKAMKVLDDLMMKKDRMTMMTVRADGPKVSRCAFAAMLKL